MSGNPQSTSRLRLLTTSIAALVIIAGFSSSVAAQSSDPNEHRWDIFGDFRLRYEFNDTFLDTPERHRGVLRFRLGGAYEINRLLRVGARVVTGDPSNPRTADITIGNFLDDLELNLDRAFITADWGETVAVGGKFPNPFMTTELVWDSDVNPAGVAASWSPEWKGSLRPSGIGMFMIVDEQTIEGDSYMWGGQVQLGTHLSSSWQVSGTIAYWDYTIQSLKSATAGDLRGNNLTPDGSAYLSDFNLLDFVLRVNLRGFRERYPIIIVADYVRNLGAVFDEDMGYSINFLIGRGWEAERFVFRYQYGLCEKDAVLAAYSNDNLPIQTNYRSHVFAAAYGVLKNTTLSLTWYLFQELPTESPMSHENNGYSSRIRLDLMVRF